MAASFIAPEDGIPPTQMHFNGLDVEPQPDGRRVRVKISLPPSMQPPNLLLIITDANGTEVSRINFIEMQEEEITFTMHIRKPDSRGPYTLTGSIYYPEMENINPFSISFNFPPV